MRNRQIDVTLINATSLHWKRDCCISFLWFILPSLVIPFSTVVSFLTYPFVCIDARLCACCVFLSLLFTDSWFIDFKHTVVTLTGDKLKFNCIRHRGPNKLTSCRSQPLTTIV